MKSLVQALEDLPDFVWPPLAAMDDEAPTPWAVFVQSREIIEFLVYGPRKDNPGPHMTRMLVYVGAYAGDMLYVPNVFRRCAVEEQLNQSGRRTIPHKYFPDHILLEVVDTDLKPLWTRARELRLDEHWQTWCRSYDHEPLIVTFRKERRTLARAWGILRHLTRIARFKRELMASACHPARLANI